jgi:hypothetical protein
MVINLELLQALPKDVHKPMDDASLGGNGTTLVFAGTFDEYMQGRKDAGLHTYDVINVINPSTVPLYTRNDFVFMEVGHYGNNPAWQAFRKEFGFTEQEKQQMVQELYDWAKLQDAKKPELVEYHNICFDRIHRCKVSKSAYTVKPHMKPGEAAHINCIYMNLKSIQMEPCYNEHSVHVGDIGMCPDCGQVFISTQHVCNHALLLHNIPQMMYQIAKATGSDYLAVQDLFLATGSLSLTEVAIETTKQVAEYTQQSHQDINYRFLNAMNHAKLHKDSLKNTSHNEGRR